ncbi:MAG TPA: TetR/AcrR family transcriptional regulator [Micromonosporaceae bacterium]|jgi:AcrR family transcriptional regulator
MIAAAGTGPPPRTRTGRSVDAVPGVGPFAGDGGVSWLAGRVAQPTRQRLTKTVRRDLIVEAARRVFLSSGLGAPVRDIAREAGVNEALVYRHFVSKDDLIIAAVVQPLEAVVRHLNATAVAPPPGSDATTRDNVAAFVHQLLLAFVDSVRLFGVVLFADRDTGQAFYQEHIVPLIDAGIANVNASMGSWSHRDFDPRVTVPASFGMCWWLALDAELRGVELDIDATVRQLVDLTFDGVTLP